MTLTSSCVLPHDSCGTNSYSKRLGSLRPSPPPLMRLALAQCHQRLSEVMDTRSPAIGGVSG